MHSGYLGGAVYLLAKKIQHDSRGCGFAPSPDGASRPHTAQFDLAVRYQVVAAAIPSLFKKRTRDHSRRPLGRRRWMPQGLRPVVAKQRQPIIHGE